MAYSVASTVELSISCSNLKNKDVLSKSDPMCVMFAQELGTKIFVEHGRTEVVKDSLFPSFMSKFVLKYYFETRQNLRFSIYDVDNKHSNLDEQDFLGSAELALGEIVSAGEMGKTAALSVGSKATINVSATEIGAEDLKKWFLVQFEGISLDKKDLFGKSDPYFKIYRQKGHGGFVPVFQSETIMKTLNPRWKQFEISYQNLCSGNSDLNLRIEVYDYDANSSDDLIGECFTTVANFLKGPGKSNVYELINPKHLSKKKNYKNSGQLVLRRFEPFQVFTMLDYLQAGLQIGIAVAVDFTASNSNGGPGGISLHDTRTSVNSYSAAMSAVGTVIEPYDSDKIFPCFGFGGRPNFGDAPGRVSHCFELHPRYNQSLIGVNRLIACYQDNLRDIQLYGPTNFSQIIRENTKAAEENLRNVQIGKAPPCYFILVIITDGQISDMEDTKRDIVYASALPMSIIIIGVGNADFSSMDELDSDIGPLQDCYGNRAQRDIVQFVSMNSVFKRTSFHSMGPEELYSNQVHLSQKVLAELPSQVEKYYKHKASPQQIAAQAKAYWSSGLSSAPYPSPASTGLPNFA